MGRPVIYKTAEERRIARVRDKRKWRLSNREKQLIAQKRWRDAHPGYFEYRAKVRRETNPERARELLRAKHMRSGEVYKEQRRRANAKRAASIKAVIERRMAQGIRDALTGRKNRRSWESLAGYSCAELAAHLESQFTDGMSWEEFRSGRIHIDHKRPRFTFNYSSAEDESFRECWALSNLRPRWASENCRAGVTDWWKLRRASRVVEAFGLCSPLRHRAL